MRIGAVAVDAVAAVASLRPFCGGQRLAHIRRLRLQAGIEGGQVLDGGVIECRRQGLHRCIAARAVLVAVQRGGQVLGVLASQARRRGIAADTLDAVASGARGREGLARGRIARCRGWRPGRLLQRVEQRDVVQVGVGHRREHRLHGVVLALAVLVGGHGRDEIFRLLPDQARNARHLADADLAMAAGAGGRGGLAGLHRVDIALRVARRGRLRRVQGRIVGRHVAQCIGAEVGDRTVHGVIAARPRQVGAHLAEEIGRALAGEVWHPRDGAYAAGAVTLCAGGFREALAFLDIHRAGMQRAKFVTAASLACRRLRDRGRGTDHPEQHGERACRDDRGPVGKPCAGPRHDAPSVYDGPCARGRVSHDAPMTPTCGRGPTAC